MKQCINCHRELPEGANFCFFCATEQNEKTELPEPALHRKKIIIISAVLAVIVAAALIIWIASGKKTIDGQGPELIYRHDGQTWHALLRNSVNDMYHWKTPEDTYARTVNSDIQAAIPLQFYIYDEASGESVADKFMEMLDRSEVTAVPAEGSSAPVCNLPAYDQGFSSAALVTDIVYDASCTDNDLVWTFHLKNGTTLVLHEKMQLTVRPDVEYSWVTTPLETSEELQALIDDISNNYDDASVKIYLPAVTYEEDITIDGLAVTLIGVSKSQTVFRGHLYINSDNPQPVMVTDIGFEGERSGITATESFFAEVCSFTDMEIAIESIKNSWPMIYQCSFSNCSIGIYTDSPKTTRRNVFFGELSFIGNETGVLLDQLQGEDVLYFVDCSFEDNGTDIENHTAHEIAYTLEGN